MRILLTLLAAGWPVLFAGSVVASTEDDAEPEPLLTETVTVTTTRLPDVPDDAVRIPANVTVISRDELAALDPADLVDLLSLEAGAVVYDQTGNDVQTTFDMRGFTRGSGTRVFLDGAPLNDGINNTLALELVPLEALERVEITRGSAAALAGGGSEAGVIHLITRRAEEKLDGALRLALGTFGASEFGGWVSHDPGPVDFVISAKGRSTDGFRDNADGELRRLAANLGFDLGPESRLGLALVSSVSDFGNPGALTAAEIEEDASASPFNSLDFADERMDLATLSFSGPLPSDLTLVANLFARERDTESLSTGRAAEAFGGFAFESEASFWGSTVQLSHRKGANVLTVGSEWLDGDTRSLGFFTPAGDPGSIPSAPSTQATSGRRTSAFFVQDAWEATGHWTLMIGARYDRDRVDLNERLPEPANDDSRSFSEVSLRGGATWSPDDRHAAYVSYGEGFLPPTSEDLFAFPGFGSNPELDPEDSRSYEIGFRRRWSNHLRLDVGLFRIDTEDEIVFDPDSDLGPFGANVNAGEARRQGIEVSMRGRIAPRLTLAADLTLTDAEFTAGEQDGKDVPLVPAERMGVGFDFDLPSGLGLHTDALWVGEQVLDNDEANQQPELEAYIVVNTRVSWRPTISGRPGGLRLFAEARNLFDEEYATRGIYAFDFSSSTNEVFLTPAPGRHYRFGAEWDF